MATTKPKVAMPIMGESSKGTGTPYLRSSRAKPSLFTLVVSKVTWLKGVSKVKP